MLLKNIFNKFRKQKEYGQLLEWINRYNRENIYQLEHLLIIEYLHIGGDFELDFVPEEIEYCQNLKELSFDKNNISEVPSTIANIKKLKTLIFKDMPLKEVPLWVFELEDLEYLTFGRTEITELPKEIGKLKKLKYLNLYTSKLKTLPDELCECENLEILSIFGSEIEAIPECLGKLKKLYTLNTECSKLKKLPDSLDKTQLTNEKTLLDINSINGEMMP